MRAPSVVAAMLAVGILATACGGSAPASGTGTGTATAAPAATTPTAAGSQVLRIAFQYEPVTMDPAAAQTVEEYQLLALTHNALFTYDNSMTIEDALAASYAWSADGKTLDVKLKPNTHFSNGDPVTAQDVAFSIQRNLDPAVKSVYAASYFGLVGAQAYFKGSATTVPGIQVVSPTEIKFQLTDVEPYFLNVLALMNSMILDHNLSGDTSKVSEAQVGTGPYTLKNWTHNESMEFVINPKYDLGAAASIPDVHIQFGLTPDLQVLQFQKGQLDIVYDIPSTNYLQIQNDAKLKADYVKTPLPSIYYLHVNPKLVPAFNKLQVRQALNYAIDKAKIVAEVTNGRGSIANGPLPPGIPGYDASLQPYPYDPAKAKQLLADAGYPNGFSMELDIVPTPDVTKLAQAVQSMLGQVGVTVTIKNFTSAVYHQMYLDHKIPFARGDWLLDYPDAQDFLYLLLDGSSPLNRFQYDNPAFDKIVEHADSITDQAQRVALYKQADDMAHNDAPWIFLYTGIYDGLFQQWVQPRDVNTLLNPILYTQWAQIHLAAH